MEPINTTPWDAATFLLVEDDEVDAEALRRAFTKSGLGNELVVVGEGGEALEWMRSESDRALESALVVLLDLHLPGMGGCELMAEMRSDPRLRHVPVFVFCSDSERAGARAADLGAEGYLSKTALLEGMRDVARTLGIPSGGCSVSGNPQR